MNVEHVQTLTTTPCLVSAVDNMYIILFLRDVVFFSSRLNKAIDYSQSNFRKISSAHKASESISTSSFLCSQHGQPAIWWIFLFFLFLFFFLFVSLCSRSVHFIWFSAWKSNCFKWRKKNQRSRFETIEYLHMMWLRSCVQTELARINIYVCV